MGKRGNAAKMVKVKVPQGMSMAKPQHNPARVEKLPPEELSPVGGEGFLELNQPGTASRPDGRSGRLPPGAAPGRRILTANVRGAKA